MKMNEFLSNGKLFPLMGVSQLNDVGDMLDNILKTEHGLKTCGSIIESRVVDGVITESDYEAIAKNVYFYYRNKWDSLLKFADEELELSDGVEKVITEYGKVVDNDHSGKDSIGTTTKIAGFDSVDFVDKDSEKHETEYGSKQTATQSGMDTKTTTKRNKQAEKLADVRLQFWDKFGITRTLIADVLRLCTLPLYDLD